MTRERLQSEVRANRARMANVADENRLDVFERVVVEQTAERLEHVVQGAVASRRHHRLSRDRRRQRGARVHHDRILDFMKRLGDGASRGAPHRCVGVSQQRRQEPHVGRRFEPPDRARGGDTNLRLQRLELTKQIGLVTRPVVERPRKLAVIEDRVLRERDLRFGGRDGRSSRATGRRLSTALRAASLLLRVFTRRRGRCRQRHGC